MAKKKSPRKAASRRDPAGRRARKPAPRRAPAKAAETRLSLYHVDAFTSRLFSGNPAAVLPLAKWFPDEILQAIAAENNLAETAFIVPKGGRGSYHIRWFTPTTEMDLCGHATLAAAHVVLRHLGVKAKSLAFSSRSGILGVTAKGDLYELDFPSRPGKPIPVSDEIVAALGLPPVECFKARDIMAVFDSKKDVLSLRPDMDRIAKLATMGVIVTAPAAGHDFVSRFFAPGVGVPEDPVTGSAHCTLVPYWAARLRKNTLSSRQVSKRGGELLCTLKGDRVLLAGRARTYLQGVVTL
ncbi:MAG: PhzF family phenazine biosynthesis protein [Phycisphaerae bacterium]|nr:PhzF family phenazine biosynthesis protein [Phycisphaerae bacterium]